MTSKLRGFARQHERFSVLYPGLNRKEKSMNRAILCGAIAVTTFISILSSQSGVAETTSPQPRPLRVIGIELQIIDIQRGTADEHTVGLSGPSEEVAARVRELESTGQIVRIDRFGLTTLEDQKAVLQAGKTMAVPTGRSNFGRGGPAQMSYQQENFGTQISAVAKVDGDVIVIELEVEKSRLASPADQFAGEGDVVPLGTETFTSQVAARIRSGQTIVAQRSRESRWFRIIAAAAAGLGAPVGDIVGLEHHRPLGWFGGERVASLLAAERIGRSGRESYQGTLG